eukprot:GHRR01015167.1.p1 GENE.GHRR01015167.1~~GHRR01015167.1.p1  ORF type:complete len:334 (+),score=92.50 GHRR01015167.1:418-1419(+)
MALGLAAVQQQVASSMQLKMQQSICQPVQLRTLCIITGKCRVRTQSFLDRPSINVTIVCASTNSSTTTSVRNKKKKKSAAADKPSAGGSSTAAAATATVTISANRADSIGTILTPKNPPLGFGNNIVPVAPLAGHAAAAAAASEDEDLDALDGLNYATGTGNPAAYRCLVLDSRYVPVNVISWPRAVVMGELGKAEVLEHHPGGFAYSAYRTHPLPAVLRVQTFVDVHEFAGKLTLTRKNVMLRDNHTCQYCGSSKDLTLDHIRPVCQGGVNSWTNLVTACMACNQKKGNKSLAQMGWNLPRVPREPTPQEVGMIAGLSKVCAIGLLEDHEAF